MSTVLSLNSGSSSLKYGVHDVDAKAVRTLWSGSIDTAGPAVGAESSAEDALVRLDTLLGQRLAAESLPPIELIGHRIVHGGPTLRRHALLGPTIQASIEAAAGYAPLHAPAALAGLHWAQQRWPALPQVACLDTAFHADLPDTARVLPLPRALRDDGLARYGFHGLSCESILHQLGPGRPARLVIAHLGMGASLTAVLDGRSVDTSMGLTPAGGVVMGTRSGDLDPGVLLWLLRAGPLDVDALEDLVERRSGLLGLSGLSGDVQVLRNAAARHAGARLALEVFVISLRKQLAGLITVLGGLDLLVFTGGIGEHDAMTRAEVVDGLACFGLLLNGGRNAQGLDPLHSSDSRAAVRCLPAQENEQIARISAALAGT